MWEIAENLHRSELTALERDEHVAEWVRLSQKARQLDAIFFGGRGNKGGVRAAARELGLSEPDARRAIKVGNLAPEAQVAASHAPVGFRHWRTSARARMTAGSVCRQSSWELHQPLFLAVSRCPSRLGAKPVSARPSALHPSCSWREPGAPSRSLVLKGPVLSWLAVACSSGKIVAAWMFEAQRRSGRKGNAVGESRRARQERAAGQGHAEGFVKH